ncbi:MAG: hypothetical protein NUV51_08035 [Sulfuricaulis sp.]|nr:hypothetical protein [Sulfuricaulis sp.]
MSEQDQQQGRDWLAIARDAYTSSTNYMDANWRKRWEDSVAMFQSRHPADSKYNHELYKHRSRLFRPKTRSVVRKNEAAAAAAFFSNVDVVSVGPENESDKAQLASSEVMSELVNYRLQKSVPWFRLLIGALQEAQVYGTVVSYQYWKYKERRQFETMVDDMGEPMLDPMTGEPVIAEAAPLVLEDKPCIELIPLENIRFDPGADWMDVVGSTPYLIRAVPMYVADVKQMMQTTDRKTGAAQWKQLSDGDIRTAVQEFDTLRSQRENRREDPKTENNAPLTDFEIVWCHENFVRLDGEEVVYWTMGTQHMLTDPKPLAEAYFHGKRPFVIGTAVIEAHKAVPDSLVQLGSQLQREANDIANSRADNVKLVLNKRWLAKRGKSVDIPSLMRNAAGTVTMVDAIDDVQEVNWPDVTASAYQEQDRINVDFDELMGNFSSGSVMTNRKLNETVGGMSMLNGSASLLTEYMLRTFVETWVEPVILQLVQLEQAYETDLVVLSLAGDKAQLAQKYGINEVTDELLNQSLTVRVNVGMGATNPETKLQKFIMATQTYAQIAANVQGVDLEAVRKEIYGLAGYRDGARFFKEGNDPSAGMLQQAQQIIGQLQQQIQALQADKQTEQMKALADVDLKQAQTVKTLIEASTPPSPQLAQAAGNVG